MADAADSHVTDYLFAQDRRDRQAVGELLERGRRDRREAVVLAHAAIRRATLIRGWMSRVYYHFLGKVGTGATAAELHAAAEAFDRSWAAKHVLRPGWQLRAPESPVYITRDAGVPKGEVVVARSALVMAEWQPGLAAAITLRRKVGRDWRVAVTVDGLAAGLQAAGFMEDAGGSLYRLAGPGVFAGDRPARWGKTYEADWHALALTLAVSGDAIRHLKGLGRRLAELDTEYPRALRAVGAWPPPRWEEDVHAALAAGRPIFTAAPMGPTDDGGAVGVTSAARLTLTGTSVESKPDGPEGGCRVRWRDKVYNVPAGVIFRLIEYMWHRASAPHDILFGPVFNDAVSPGAIRAWVSEANTVLSKIGVPSRLRNVGHNRTVIKAPVGVVGERDRGD